MVSQVAAELKVLYLTDQAYNLTVYENGKLHAQFNESSYEDKGTCKEGPSRYMFPSKEPMSGQNSRFQTSTFSVLSDKSINLEAVTNKGELELSQSNFANNGTF